MDGKTKGRGRETKGRRVQKLKNSWGFGWKKRR
jgi:hypothetical protein